MNNFTQKIVPHLWFDKEARQAAEFYTSIFPNSKMGFSVTLPDTPSGNAEVVNFTIMNYEVASISAGPFFKINPSISLMVNFDPSQDPQAATRIDEIWNALADGGKVLMPIGEYPFCKRYGWIQDKFGTSWQLLLTDPQGDERPLIMPGLLFTQNVCGKADEAMDFYQSVFKGAKRGQTAYYPAGMPDDKEGTVMFSEIKIADQWLVAMDSGAAHDYTFNEGVSLIVNCDSQEEMDYFYDNLSAVPESEQCGWIKDKYGVSWQIVPYDMNEIMATPDKEKFKRMSDAMLEMKRLDVEKLKSA